MKSFVCGVALLGIAAVVGCGDDASGGGGSGNGSSTGGESASGGSGEGGFMVPTGCPEGLDVSGTYSLSTSDGCDAQANMTLTQSGCDVTVVQGEASLGTFAIGPIGIGNLPGSSPDYDMTFNFGNMPYLVGFLAPAGDGEVLCTFTMTKQ